MRNLSMLTPVVSIFCIFFLLYQITLVASSTPRYVPDEAIITLDCGSATDKSKDMYGRDWTGDFQSKFFPKEELNNLKSNTSKAPEEGTVTKAPYSTARISSSQFTYVFPVTVGPKFVRLHFNPVIYQVLRGPRPFSLLTQVRSPYLETSLLPFLLILCREKTFFKEFCINAGKDQKLNLTFIPFSTTFNAFINGIEIVPMPDDLYYKPQGKSEEGIPNLSGNPFYINDDMALEMVYRLNVAGNLISPTDDTGFFRQWSSDNNYFKRTGTLMPHQPSWILDYVNEPNYTAPDDVYRSARTMGFNSTKNKLSNLTWGLPVDTGFNYLVRLHFCEIYPNIIYAGERQFVINIDSLLAEQDADVILWTDKIGRPVYKDYVVNIRKKGDEGSHSLSIDLHPGTLSYFLDDAILNGAEVFKLSNSDGNLAGPSQMQPILLAALANKEKESNTKKTIFIVIGGGVGFLVVLTSVCIFVLFKLRKSRSYGSYFPLSKCWCWHNPYKGNSTRTKALSLPRELCRHFSIDEIRTATYNFHQELIIGRGGFGCVYKGFIDQLAGTTIVAIKRLNPESRQGAREFKTEIKMLSQLRHGHLVSLIGYCNDEGEMILVYEYMINGTLSDHLFDTKKDALTWKQRLEICIGAAHGLHYLHTCMKNPIIHRDVKATNILLDDKWGSKVSDFGLSKMGLHETAVSSMVKGTFGYLDPDYARNQQVTAKSDVYSFGVVLLEVLCGRKALNSKLEQEQWHLANWARKCIEKGTINQVIDPHLKGKIAPDCFKVYVEVAESCVRDHGIDRPTMNDVMEKLEFAFELQQNADAEQEKINPSGDITYQEVLSFRVSGRTTDVGASQHINVSNGPMFESDSSIVLSTGIIRDVTVNSNTTT